MASPPRRFLFDLNVAQEEPDEWDEPEEAVEEERAMADAAEEEVVEEAVEEVVEPEELIMEEEEPMEELTMEEVVEEEEVTMGEEDAAAAAAAAAAEVGEEEVREGRKKRRDYEVFVGGLPLDAAEEDVKRALAEAGEVEEVRLTRDPGDPKLNRGFAFVRFAAAWEARWAANGLRMATIKGKACVICKNSENETLHLRNICFDWSKDDLAEKLKPFELENLDRINLIEHPEKRGKNRGYAFLDFRTHVDAVAAFLKLQKGDLFLGTDFRAHVSFSNTLSQDDEVMEKVKSVFLDGLPPHWDEDKVREKFGKFGEIDSIQLARNMFTAKRKDFGFIGFTARQSALDCINVVNRDGVGEGTEKVGIKATLQRPRPAFKKPSWQECDLNDYNASSYHNCDYGGGDKSGVGHSYQYQNEELSSTSGCEQAYLKKDRKVTTSTGSQDCPLVPSSSAIVCDCRDCYLEQESSPSSSERVRTRSSLQAPLHHAIVKPSHEHRRSVPDEHSTFEVDYTVRGRESRGRYSSSRHALSSHSRKHHRPARQAVGVTR
ncbi:hypothetical protein PR202_gb25342 [Eleusine coracana subsp. coracana]|uniref:RRM domain-containing protein n=1 Tax=Eleusine coracana subsp. coracana TaxID=191504 RepID=A0AAV5FQD3_ELECO|nr:hypothetical protein PR202_gb25297 [Eleusine coracana subsp. coracana]GJN36481.1 hypothetical protein PR202_gb25342 [Eleusine coracana subsp. coracana]